MKRLGTSFPGGVPTAGCHGLDRVRSVTTVTARVSDRGDGGDVVQINPRKDTTHTLALSRIKEIRMSAASPCRAAARSRARRHRTGALRKRSAFPTGPASARCSSSVGAPA